MLGPTADLKGRHPVVIGSSLTADTQDSPYVAFKYNFRPGTMDTSRPATLTGGSTDGTGEYTLSVPSRDEGPSHVFKSTQAPQKDIDCLLIYDEETQSYRLERLSSVLRMDHQRSHGSTASTSTQRDGSAVEHFKEKHDTTSQQERTKTQAGAVSKRAEEAITGKQNNSSAIQNLTKPKSTRLTVPSNTSETSVSRTRNTTNIDNTTVRQHPQHYPSPRLPPVDRIPSPPPPEEDDDDDTEMNDEEEEEDGDLDDLANMLESTLDEASRKPQAVTVKRPSIDDFHRTSTRADESSEDED